MNAEIQMRDPLRNELAAKMAEFEAMRGLVVTQPIVQRDGKATYNGTVVSKAAAQAKIQTRVDRSRKKEHLPLAKRGTRQARQRAVLRENWG
jgi:hypothetical protein